MMYTHFIGRIGRDGAKVVNGNKGQFLSMDVATDIFTKGENKTLWVRVRSNKEYHIGLAEYLTKGRLILVEGTLLEPSIWKDKNEEAHAQLSLTADSINFVNSGRRKESTDSIPENGFSSTTETKEGASESDVPFTAPEDEAKDLPF